MKLKTEIYAGDLVLIKLQNNIENGKIFLVSLENKETALRRIYTRENTYVFQSDNAEYYPYIINNTEELNDKIMIIGKAIHVKFTI